MTKNMIKKSLRAYISGTHLEDVVLLDSYSTRLDKAITKCNNDSSKLWASYTNYSISIRPSRNPSISPGIVDAADDL